MLQVKVKAQRLMALCGGRALLFALLSALSAAAGAVCGGLALACAVLGTQAVFAAVLPPETFARLPGAELLLPGACAVLCGLNALCAGTFAYGFRGLFYTAAAGETPEPARLLRVKNGLRYLEFLYRRALLRARLALISAAPALLTLLLCFALLGTVGMPAALTGICAAFVAVQLALGAGFYVLHAGRSRLALFLLCVHPELPVPDAFVSGALLSEGRLSRLLAAQLRLLPWWLFSLFILPLPFTLRYLPAMEGAIFAAVYQDKGTLRDLNRNWNLQSRFQ